MHHLVVDDPMSQSSHAFRSRFWMVRSASWGFGLRSNPIPTTSISGDITTVTLELRPVQRQLLNSVFSAVN